MSTQAKVREIIEIHPMARVRDFIVDQVRDNAVSIAFQMLATLVAVGFLWYAVQDVKRDAIARVDAAESAIAEWLKTEAAKLEGLAEDVETMSASVALLASTTAGAVYENKDEIVGGVKEHGPGFVRDWLRSRRGDEGEVVEIYGDFGGETTEVEPDAQEPSP